MENMRRFSRRTFIAWVGGAGAGFYLFGRVPGMSAPLALAQVPGGTLDPATIPKFQAPLLIPPVMPKAGTIDRRGSTIDYYEISMKQLAQQILPAGLPATTVWGYGAVKSASPGGLLLHHAPSLTIEAQVNRPVRVKWINDLKDADDNYLPHLLPVDQTLHWANPPGGVRGRDSRPTFTSTPGPYTGPVPIVTHVHGAVGVADDSDGYAEAWYLPAAKNIPPGYARDGTWFRFFASRAAGSYGVGWGPGFATFQYPNEQPGLDDLVPRPHARDDAPQRLRGPGRLLSHPGWAGRRQRGNRHALRHARLLPGPAPREDDGFPPSKPYYEIPIAIQDRSFNADGSLFYPDSRVFFDGIVHDYIPEGEFSPIWNPEFFGNTIMVNGNTWPFLIVEQRRYRFRFLDGCQSRFLILDFGAIPGVKVWQIGNEGGFLAAPVNLTANHGNRLLMALAERADVIVDFTNVPTGNYVLANVGPDEPFGGGVPGDDFDVADPGTTGQVMQFRVVPVVGVDDSTPPQFLRLPAITPLPAATVTRQLALIEEASEGADEEGEEVEGPVEALLGTVADGVWTERKWMDPVTENPDVGATEVWEIYNTTADAHPMHIHEIAFEVVNREGLVLNAEGEVAEPIQLDGDSAAPEPWETGFKDTVIAYPGQVTRVKAQFNHPGQFVWHCHIVEHEDNEMMRPYRIGPPQPGQPH